jgi:hypothetical protein
MKTLNIPNGHLCNISNVCKMYHTYPFQGHSNCPNWDFWYANIPSGNPGCLCPRFWSGMAITKSLAWMPKTLTWVLIPRYLHTPLKARLLVWVARWCCDEICWYLIWPSGIFYGFWVYFRVIWYILPVWVSCSKKNLATLLPVAQICTYVCS